MALKPTIYKLKITLADIDTAYYDTLSLTIAQHPSETLERMMARVLAFWFARLTREAYSLLDLVSFLTTGEKETRAWTIKKGTKAPQAAAVIHTDFEKHFIRAEVVPYEDLVAAGSWASARENGKLRTEGKGYVFQDGEVTVFLTSA